MPNRTAYLQIRQFNEQATKEFREHITELDKNTKGLILDLRQNAGGVRTYNLKSVDGYESALKLLETLNSNGTVALLETRPKQREPLKIVGKSSFHYPVVVLVDHGTANIAELVASALRDSKKAKLVGTNTFGDSILPLFAVLKNGAGLEINSGRILTANGTDLKNKLNPISF